MRFYKCFKKKLHHGESHGNMSASRSLDIRRVSRYLRVGALQADSEALKDGVEREGEEEHEGAEGGVSLEVHVDVVALGGRARSAAREQRRPLLLRRPVRLPTAQDKPLQDEDHEEAGGHDELWKREAGLSRPTEVNPVS